MTKYGRLSGWADGRVGHEAVVAVFISEIEAELDGPSKTIIVEPVEVPEPAEPVEAPAAPEREPVPA